MKKNTEQVEAQTDDFQTIGMYILGILKGFILTLLKKVFFLFWETNQKRWASVLQFRNLVQNGILHGVGFLKVKCPKFKTIYINIVCVINKFLWLQNRTRVAAADLLKLKNSHFFKKSIFRPLNLGTFWGWYVEISV